MNNDEALKRLEAYRPLEQYTLLGFQICVNPSLDNVPRMQLSEKVKQFLTPEFIEETNDWLLKFFGTESQIITDNTYKIMYMGPVTLRKVKAQAEGLGHPLK